LNILERSQRTLPWFVVVLSALLVSPAVFARMGHSDIWAREKFAAAERMRETLNGRSADDRSRHDYQRVIDSFRRVYFGAPSSPKADPSAVAVAELLTEMGQRFDDERILHSAVEQYRFLRREYPGSKHRSDALFAIGEIYKDDLNEPRRARSAFEEFLRSYPNHRLAEGARQALSEISEQAANKQLASKREGHKDTDLQQHRLQDSGTGKAKGDEGVLDQDLPNESKPHNIQSVTAIRYWSTPDYTRVAIDLEQKVEFDAQRIDHPKRIFFDLQNTQLSSTLAARSFDVDDGFLKRVRVAQFQPGRTRVVLDVEDLSDYNAFVLTNPCRLIIDVRGKVSKTSTKRERPSALLAQTTAKPDAKTAERNDSKLDSPQSPQTIQAPVVSNTSAAKSDGKKQGPLQDGDRQVGKSAQSSLPTSQMPPVKKIVEADDEGADVAVTALQPADLRPEITSAQRQPVAAPPAAKSAKSARNFSDRNLENRNSSEVVNSTQGSRRRRSSAADIDVREARPTSKGDRSLIRALGLKIGKIVIDPGHGGHDTGTIGPNGLEEKDLVLGVATRLGKLLESRLGAEVIYTREDDTFIPLETRTAIANQEQADLFVSIHANSSRDPEARGVETYYLNFTSNPDALEVAARENVVSDKSIHELQDLVRKIALKEKIEESREFASDVQHALHTGLSSKSPAIRNRGVKKAPFIVLIGANMPSILAEISFISNPSDERKLETAEYRQRIAESLFRGISQYVAGLSGVKVASHMANANTH
jgi:N-acetylmuramoyl-L-alanine amidase